MTKTNKSSILYVAMISHCFRIPSEIPLSPVTGEFSTSPTPSGESSHEKVDFNEAAEKEKIKKCIMHDVFYTNISLINLLKIRG